MNQGSGIGSLRFCLPVLRLITLHPRHHPSHLTDGIPTHTATTKIEIVRKTKKQPEREGGEEESPQGIH
jgi:hypothetical protein